MQRCCSATVGEESSEGIGGVPRSGAARGARRKRARAPPGRRQATDGARLAPASRRADRWPRAARRRTLGRSRRQPRHARSRPTSHASATFFRPARSKADPAATPSCSTALASTSTPLSRPPRRGEPRSLAASTSGPPSYCGRRSRSGAGRRWRISGRVVRTRRDRPARGAAARRDQAAAGGGPRARP